MKRIFAFLREEDGATAVEYGVLIALIIAVCIIVIAALGEKIEEAFQKVNGTLENAKVGGGGGS